MNGRTRGTCQFGISIPALLAMLAVLLAAGLGFVLVQNNSSGDRRDRGDLFSVRHGSFDITIPASGELVALQQIEIRNRLESRATIMEIIDEGKTVQAGDLLLRLNDEELRNRIKDAEDAVNSAESALVAAEATLAIRKSSAASELDRAHLNLSLARLALQAWREGEVLARQEELELNVQTARINFQRLKDRFENSQRLHADQFISADELKRDEIAMIEAEARYKQAVRDRDVYHEYTYLQQKMQKESDVEQAEAELDRVQQRHEAELETARADVTSRRHQLESRRERLSDLQTQLEHTVVRAPSEGLVVYATSMEQHRRGTPDPPQVGTDLSRNELVMLLPDTSRMVAAVKINEALSGLIRRGLRARITSDAMPDKTINGEVLSVGVLAETGGWRDPNRRDYTVRILLTDENNVGLRPSMRARAEIFIDRVDEALYVPVQSVYRQGRNAHVYVPVRGGYQARDVTLGRASELYVEVLDGLYEGDLVLMREPQAHELIDRDDRRRLAQAEIGGEEPAPAARPDDGAGEGPEQRTPRERPAGQRPPGERGDRPAGQRQRAPRGDDS